MKNMKDVETAVRFLTVFGIGKTEGADVSAVGRSAWAFPIVGAVIGSALIALKLLFDGYLPNAIQGLLLVAAWVAITGALHLDGWSDCCDALFSAVSPERRAEIMKDSRLGTFGAIGLFLLTGLKAASLASLGTQFLPLLMAPIVGRSMMVIVSYGAGPKGSGMASAFLSALDRDAFRMAWIFLITAALVGGWSGLAAATAAYAFGLVFRRFAESRLNGINGDVIGAICELSETVFLIAFVTGG